MPPDPRVYFRHKRNSGSSFFGWSERGAICLLSRKDDPSSLVRLSLGGLLPSSTHLCFTERQNSIPSSPFCQAIFRLAARHSSLHLIFSVSFGKDFLFHVRAICPAGRYNLLRYVIVSCCNARRIPPQFAGRLAGLPGNRGEYFPALLSCATFSIFPLLWRIERRRFYMCHSTYPIYSLKSFAMNCGPLSEMIPRFDVWILLLARSRIISTLRFFHGLPNFPMDYLPAITV